MRGRACKVLPGGWALGPRMSNEPDTPAPREVRFTPEFKRNLRQLAKKYRRIRSDIQPVIDALRYKAHH